MILLQVLVAVELVGVGSRTVEARYAADSSLELPAVEVRDLLGVTAPVPWVAIPALERAYPTVIWTWLAREMRLLVEDPRGALPATAAARAATFRRAQNASSFAYRTFSGPFGSLTADEDGRSAVEVGYNLGGKAAVAGSYLPSAHRGSWTAGLAPWPVVSLSLNGSDRVETATARVAAGPAWAFLTWAPGQPLAADGLVALGPVAVFASSRHSYVITLTHSPLVLQLGRSGSITATRLSFGPQPASPFTIPAVPMFPR